MKFEMIWNIVEQSVLEGPVMTNASLQGRSFIRQTCNPAFCSASREMKPTKPNFYVKHDKHDETLPPRRRLDTHKYTVLPIQLTRVSPAATTAHRVKPMPRATRVMEQARGRRSDLEIVSEKWWIGILCPW